MVFTNSVFGTKHIIILLVSIAAIVLGVIFGKKLKLQTTLRILLVLGIVSETIKIVYYILTNENVVAYYTYNAATESYTPVTFNGYLPKTDLPFHLCSIQLIFIFILNITKNEKLRKLLLSFMLPTCLIGGFAALVLATSSSLNGLWILSFQYFGYHAGIVWFATLLLVSDEVKFTAKDYANCLIMLVAVLFVAIYLNSWIWDYGHNINFMYVVAPPMSGLPFLNKDHGWGVYIAHYILLCLFAVTLVYIKPIINWFKERKAAKVQIETEEPAPATEE